MMDNELMQLFSWKQVNLLDVNHFDDDKNIEFELMIFGENPSYSEIKK